MLSCTQSLMRRNSGDLATVARLTRRLGGQQLLQEWRAHDGRNSVIHADAHVQRSIVQQRRRPARVHLQAGLRRFGEGRFSAGASAVVILCLPFYERHASCWQLKSCAQDPDRCSASVQEHC